MLHHKNIDTEYKVRGDSGKFTGLGAAFGNKDFGGDVILEGAFDDTLTDWQTRHAKGQRMPILWQHDFYEPIGGWEDLRPVKTGLQGDGDLLIEDDPLASRAYGHIKKGNMGGLSIGYRIPKGGFEYDHETDTRYLKRIDLHEISIVTFGMNDEARIDAVKAAEMSNRELERVLTQDAKLSRSVARQLMSGGYKSIQAMQDAGEDASELVRMLKRRTEILKAC